MTDTIDNIVRPYRDSDAALPAIVADLADALTDAHAAPVATGAGWAHYRNGDEVTWFSRLSRPVRRTGVITLVDPASFADYVLRLRTPDTTLYADRDAGTITAVLDDHPETSGGRGADTAEAGFRQNRAVLRLRTGDDFGEWVAANSRSMTQAVFGDHVDMMAHTMVNPDAASMMEIATTLTAKGKIDIDSRVRLDNGDVTFSIVEETQLKAGRGSKSIEVPTTFTFAVRPWRGTDPVEFDARLRIKAGGHDGVSMSYKMLRVEETLDNAFAQVVGNVLSLLGDGFPMYLGSAESIPTIRY